MGHYLYRLTEKFAAALLVDDVLVYAAGGDVVALRCVSVEETLVVAEVEVGLGAVFGDVTFTVFVRVERTRVYVEVGVELLYCHVVAAGLQQLGQRRRYDAFAQR